jgi:hypothetical protein
MPRPAAQQVAVALLGHPADASQMALPRAAGSGKLAVRVTVQHEPRDLLSVDAVRFGVEQAQIGHDVPFVVARQNGRSRGFIGDLRVERWVLHGQSGQRKR